MEEIDIFVASDDSTPPGVESDYDSEGDILLLEELLNDDLVPLAEYNHFTFDVEPDTFVKNNVDELNEDECFDPGGGENNVEVDDSFKIVIRTFLQFLTYPEILSDCRAISKEDARLECPLMAERQPDFDGAHDCCKFKVCSDGHLSYLGCLDLELNSLIEKKHDILKTLENIEYAFKRCSKDRRRTDWT
ncbi:hypothetical protein Tco_0418136 [Tanacetum coccineum]